MSRSSSNCSVTWERPKELCDDMVESDGIWPNWRSSGAVTSEAMVSGLAPGSWVVIWIVGKSTCGSAETGRRTKPRTPQSRTAKPRSDVAIGRSMKGVERLIARGRPLAGVGPGHCPENAAHAGDDPCDHSADRRQVQD